MNVWSLSLIERAHQIFIVISLVLRDNRNGIDLSSEIQEISCILLKIWIWFQLFYLKRWWTVSCCRLWGSGNEVLCSIHVVNERVLESLLMNIHSFTIEFNCLHRLFFQLLARNGSNFLFWEPEISSATAFTVHADLKFIVPSKRSFATVHYRLN